MSLNTQVLVVVNHILPPQAFFLILLEAPWLSFMLRASAQWGFYDSFMNLYYDTD